MIPKVRDIDPPVAITSDRSKSSWRLLIGEHWSACRTIYEQTVFPYGVEAPSLAALKSLFVLIAEQGAGRIWSRSVRELLRHELVEHGYARRQSTVVQGIHLASRDEILEYRHDGQNTDQQNDAVDKEPPGEGMRRHQRATT